MDSLREHFEVPSTFEGEIPEFSLDSDLPRLMIGNTYLVPDETGHEVPGVLEECHRQRARESRMGSVRKSPEGSESCASRR